SPLVHSAVVRNFAVLCLCPTDPAAPYPPPRPLDQKIPQIPDAHRSLTRLVAVHLRRGDYTRHCHCPRAGYMGVNTHPSLPDRFLVPSANSTASPRPRRTSSLSQGRHAGMRGRKDRDRQRG
ncbi:hypothetical protein K438DRAFT_2073895, partial [Mycena galopus ATCC 62051]